MTAAVWRRQQQAWEMVSAHPIWPAAMLTRFWVDGGCWQCVGGLPVLVEPQAGGWRLQLGASWHAPSGCAATSSAGRSTCSTGGQGRAREAA